MVALSGCAVTGTFRQDMVSILPALVAGSAAVRGYVDRLAGGRLVDLCRCPTGSDVRSIQPGSEAEVTDDSQVEAGQVLYLFGIGMDRVDPPVAARRERHVASAIERVVAIRNPVRHGVLVGPW